MKKQKHQILFLALLGAYFLLNGLIVRNNNLDLETRIKELQNEGYTLKASEKIAKVELNLLPVDEEYTALIED